MPRALTSAILEASREEVTYFQTCWKLTLENGTVMGFTSHVKDIIVSSVTYGAASGYTPTSVDSSNRFNVDNVEVDGLITGNGLTVADIEGGEFDGARVEIFLVDPRTPNAGKIIMRTGTLGNIMRRDDTEFSAEIRGLTQRLQQTVTELYAPACKAALGDDRCKVVVSAPVWSSATYVSTYTSGDAGSGTNAFIRSATLQSRFFKATVGGTTGTSEPAFSSTVGATVSDGSVTWETIYAWRRSAVVSSVTSRDKFTCVSMDEPVNHWKLGKCTFKTGDNAGRDMEIKKNTAAGNVVLYMPMASNITAGDVVILEAGCSKRKNEDCRDRFDNIVNFRGIPWMPGADALMGGSKKS